MGKELVALLLPGVEDLTLRYGLVIEVAGQASLIMRDSSLICQGPGGVICGKL